MTQETTTQTSGTPGGWYRYGVMFLYLEMFIAIAVSAYSLYMAFTGKGGFPGKH
ncbi:hypothetical protein [Acidihalobacter ferrooxydans]|uniref:hypothetical protein n=1 Tax=Acidihalobacter ferrooxydans TaxID=1765967 RepID=UPI0018DDBF8F|nr:hypothetical protein [Acidihalobacter ferrooxydans]